MIALAYTLKWGNLDVPKYFYEDLPESETPIADKCLRLVNDGYYNVAMLFAKMCNNAFYDAHTEEKNVNMPDWIALIKIIDEIFLKKRNYVG